MEADGVPYAKSEAGQREEDKETTPAKEDRAENESAEYERHVPNRTRRVPLQSAAAGIGLLQISEGIDFERTL